MAAPTTSPSDGQYIRGGGAVEIGTGRIVRILLALCVATLAALAAILAVVTANSNSRQSALSHHGVRVTVTATSCLGVSSGIGMGVESYDCRGTFSLGNRSYLETIRGSHSDLVPGQQVQAVTLVGDPAALTLAASVHRAEASYTVSIVLAAVTVVSIGVWMVVARRRRPPAPS